VHFLRGRYVTAGSKTHKLGKIAWSSSPGVQPYHLQPLAKQPHRLQPLAKSMLTWEEAETVALSK